MKIGIVGSGYVGLVTGVCFSEVGFETVCVDVDQKKIEKLRNGTSPIFEPGLETLLTRNIEKKRLYFTTDLATVVNDVDVIFSAVGTPPDEDGSADLQYVLEVAKTVGQHMNKYILLITKSTVPVGTAKLVKEEIKKQLVLRGVNIPFDVASNPEFLKEGDAISDFMRPDRIVVGVESEEARNIFDKLYQPFVLNGHPIIYTDIASAEMIKYAANSMLATRISFMNEMANLCERVGADIHKVREGIGSDSRIGKKFLYAGAGYGGSCFPKDVKALIKTADSLGYSLDLLKAVECVNENQKEKLFYKIDDHFNGALADKKIAILGLAFKPNTDDMREAPALVTITMLLEKGAKIYAYDPEAMEETKRVMQDKITLCQSAEEAMLNADAVVLVTEWGEFKTIKPEKLNELMNKPVLFDGRNIYNREEMREGGVVYYGMGR